MATTNGGSAISEGQHEFGLAGKPAAHALDASTILGPPSGAMRVNPYDKVRYTNFDYPESVRGQTLFVETTITGFILESNEWYTTVCLPWSETEQNEVTWNEWHFTRSLADLVPHEGVSRLITSNKEEHKGFVVRRGLAFVMEADFANTDAGIENFMLNVQSIAQSVQETQNHDTIYELLSCKNYKKIWSYRHGQERVSFTQIEDSNKETFNSVCMPEGDGSYLEVLFEQAKRQMNKQNVEPDMFILTPGMRIYLGMTSPVQTQYWSKGPDGVRRLKEGPAAVANYRGVPVFETRDFEVYDDSPRVQLLTRPWQIAETYTMRFERRHENVDDFTSKERSVFIYDANADDWRKITFLEAFKNAQVFGADGHWDNRLIDLAEEYNNRGEKGNTSNDDEESVRHRNDEPSHTMFLLHQDNEGRWSPIKRFGQMHPQHTTPMDMKRVGETIASKVHPFVRDGAFLDLVGLIDDIEAQPYNQTYLEALIAENTATSVASDGTFVGEVAPEDVSKHWGISNPQPEWKPNAYGSLRLPRNTYGAEYPLGVANAPGLRTLAAETSVPGSPWAAAGARAKRGLAVLQSILDVLKSLLPSSAVLDVKGRAPWFHRPDALTTMFSHIVSVPRAPLFLLSLPPVGATGEGLSDAASLRRGQPARGPSAPRAAGRTWFTVPGSVPGAAADESLTADNAEDVRRAVETGDFTGLGRSTVTSASDGSVAFYSPTLGTTVEVPIAAFTATQLTPELAALGALPGGDSDLASDVRRAYMRSMATLVGDNNAAHRRRLMDFVYNMGTQLGLDAARIRMWKTVLVLGTGRYSADSLKDQIDRIYVEPGLPDAESVQRTRQSGETVKGLSDSASGSSAQWSALTPLGVTWRTTGASAAGRGARLAYQSIAADMQQILDLQAQLVATSDATADDFVRPLAPAGGPFAGGSGVDDAVAEMRALVIKVNTAIARQNPGDSDAAAAARPGAARAAEERARAERGRGGAVEVASDPADIAGSRYFRAPMTASLGLINSMSTLFGGQTTIPLVLPGDPATRHTQALTGGAFPGDVLGSTAYDALSAAIQAPVYATMSEITLDPTLRRLDDMDFVTRASTADSDPSAAESFRAGAPLGRRAFADEDFSDDEEDATTGFFKVASGDAQSGPSLKRARFATTGAPLIGAHEGNPGGDLSRYSQERTAAMNSHWTEANKIADPVVRACVHAFLSTDCQKEDSWTRLIENDVLVPVGIDLWRVNIVLEMASAILMKSGRTTGANLQGTSNAARGHDTVSKLIYFNFTFRSKAVVWNEKNVHIIENIKSEKYGGGLNSKFIKHQDDLRRTDSSRPSLISVLVPMNEPDKPNIMDFSGTLNLPQINPEIDNPQELHYSTAEYYDRHVWKLSDEATEGDPREEDFFERAERMTWAAYQGTQFSFNKSSGAFTKFVQPQSYLKKGMCYPGAFKVLNGMGKVFERYNYEAVRLEV